MNKMLSALFCIAVLSGCRTSEISPDTCWSDYGRYYSPTGAATTPVEGAAEIRTVKSREASATLATLQSQGSVLLGTFLINDETEITPAAVSALAKKLNASAVIWTTENILAATSALPNPDMGIVGVDNVQLAHINANRPDETTAQRLITHKHTIWMLGKKNQE